MARGMAAGEPIVSQARTEEYDKGYDAAFGADRKPERGRWIWDPERKELVRAEDYVPPSRAVDAPVMVGRFYETMQTVDGADITSRAKHKAYCEREGVTPFSDYSPGWFEGVQKAKRREAKKSRREAIERAFYKMQKP